MRKILLGTTAVVGAALIAPMAMAQMPVTVEPPRALAGSAAGLTVRLGGYFDFRAGLVGDDADRNSVVAGTGVNQRRFGRQRVDFQSDMELNVFVDGKASNGLQYGLVMEFQIDNVGAGGPGTSLDTDEFYGFVSHPAFGTLRFGDEDGAGNLLQVRTPLIRGADTDNYWDEFTFRSGGDASPSFFTALSDGSDSTKIIYLSPQFFGFDFGVSYAPNTGEGERFALGTAVNSVTSSVPTAVGQRDRSSLRNEISAGVRYRGTFGGVGIAASLVGMQSDSQQRYAALNSNLANRVTAYSGGLQLSAFGFTVGGEYTWGDYSGISVGRAAIVRGREQSNQWVAGATYTIPGTPVQLGGFYGRATQDNGIGFADRKQTIYGGGLNYAVAPGMTAYLTYTHLRDQNEVSGGAYVDNNQAAAGTQRNRNLDVYLAGFRIAF
ncbi:porin [Plastoroseomonas hellenica]|uniref:Porin n=1 Tax=Plastoroseomonas hellenica TaxID=2687306 RepID=A0ABS5F388_9PROT|nr:porin [Plastoroseomonas hellenica]MBR0644384.1 porin [Plastoroseomonas hellenica]MBR0667024.1 porin [Plastoroseomonas hellenica]